MVEIVDSKVITSGSINGIYVNHHCSMSDTPGTTGGLCASHYVFNNVDFINNNGADPEPKFYSETRDVAPPMWRKTDVLIFYDGQTLFDKDQAHLTCSAAGNGCSDDGDWTKCPDTLGIRSVRIYSPDRGSLTITTLEGGPYTVLFRNLRREMGYVNAKSVYLLQNILLKCFRF